VEPLLVDTSVWIDFFRGRKSRECSLLISYIDKNEPVLLCPPVIQEILQGIKEDVDYLSIKERILSFDIVSIEPLEAAVGAADLYRSLRKTGTTVRKSMDCLIAYHAIYFKVALLHKDSDFDRIAKHSALRIRKFN